MCNISSCDFLHTVLGLRISARWHWNVPCWRSVRCCSRIDIPKNFYILLIWRSVRKTCHWEWYNTHIYTSHTHTYIHTETHSYTHMHMYLFMHTHAHTFKNMHTAETLVSALKWSTKILVDTEPNLFSSIIKSGTNNSAWAI